MTSQCAVTDVTADIMTSLDAVEEQSGPLTPDNKAALQALVKRITVRRSSESISAEAESKAEAPGSCYQSVHS